LKADIGEVKKENAPVDGDAFWDVGSRYVCDLCLTIGVLWVDDEFP
jgi:hypothetical protein